MNTYNENILKRILLYAGVFLLSAPFIALIVLCVATLIFGFVFMESGIIIPVSFIIVVFFTLIILLDLWVAPKILQNILNESKIEKRKEYLSKISSVFLGLIYLAAGASIITINLTSIPVERKIKELKKAGYPTSFGDLCVNHPKGKNAAKGIEKFSKERSDNKKKGQTAEDYIREKKDLFLIKRWGDEDRSKVSKLTSNNPMLQEYKDIIGGADFYAFFDCKRRFAEQTADSINPGFSGMLEYSRQIAYEARLHSEHGNYAEAVKNLQIIKKSILLLRSEPFLVNGMMAVALQKMMGLTLIALLNMNGKGFDADLLSDISEVSRLNLVEHAMKTEVAFLVESYRHADDEKETCCVQVEEIPLLYTYLSGAMHLDIITYLCELELNFKNSTTEKNQKLSKWPFVNSSYLPRWKSMFDSEKESDFLLQNMNILQAAIKFYGTYKKPPEHLEDLLEFGIEEGQLVDPFLDGKAKLRMKSEPDGLYIYSVGKDGVDNNGDITGDDVGYLLWKKQSKNHSLP